MSEGWGLCVLPVVSALCRLICFIPFRPSEEIAKRNSLVFCVQLASRPGSPTKSPSLPQKFISMNKGLLRQRSQTAETAALILLCHIYTRAGKRASALRERAVTSAALLLGSRGCRWSFDSVKQILLQARLYGEWVSSGFVLQACPAVSG